MTPAAATGRGDRRQARSLPARLGAAAMIACLAAACSSGGDGGGGANPNATLRFATDQQPDCLDPQVSNADVVATVDRSVVDSLVAMTPDGKFHPWLAKSWTTSADGRTYTFELRSGVTFADGTPLDAAAVKATLDHAVDPATKSKYAVSLLGPFQSATVVNPSTVAITLSQPYIPLLQALSTAYLGIQSSKSLHDNAGQLCQKVVGSGPFELASFTKNVSAVLKRNPAYQWGPESAGHTGPAKVAGITISFVSEDSVRVGSLTSGQADVIEDVPPVSAKQVRDAGLGLHTGDQPGSVYELILKTTGGPFADEKVRQAFQRGIDIDQLVKTVYFGQYKRAWSSLGPSTLDYDPSTEGSWKADPTTAGQLLDQAGWTARDSDGFRTKDGARLTVSWPYVAQNNRGQRTTLGQSIQAEAKKIGIDLQFKAEDAGTFIQQSTTNTGMDVFASSFVRAEPDILSYWFASAKTIAKGGGNAFKLNDPKLDQLLSDATQNGDAAARKSDYAQAQHYILDHAYAVPVYVPTNLVGSAKQVQGLTFAPEAYPMFYDAWLGNAG